jgi:hypothetical protein
MDVVIAAGLSLATVALYLAPSALALAGRAADATRIVAINFFAGWTVIGWAVTLFWAARSVRAARGARRAGAAAASLPPGPCSASRA